MNKDIKRIAYGVSDFESIQTRNDYYVDKTHFIPALEDSRYTFFIRPRRFGKSLWLSILETYYDIAKKDRFEEFFHNTWIIENRTEEQGHYMVLFFNFSMVRATPEKVEESFENYGEIRIHGFLSKYKAFFTPEQVNLIKNQPTVSSKLSHLFQIGEEHSLNIYVLIDEYDNFANTILSTMGERAYHDLTHGDSFYRHFFAVLKGGTGSSGGGLQRLFITGVSPITMDDVTSGFNIGDNISLQAQFNAMVGFTEDEVLQMLEYYQQKGVFKQNVEETLSLMKLWYNNYQFGKNVKEAMLNTDMVIYFVKNSIRSGSAPDELIDQNIRIDYGKLKHLILVSRKLNGNFDHLKAIIEEGQVSSTINTRFPLEHLNQPENFISLLYYFGLLTYAGTELGVPVLKVPNLTVQHLMYSYIREAYRDVDTFRIDLHKLNILLSRMAYLGEWENVFDFLADEVQQQTSIRDYLSEEKVIQGFLLAYLNISDFFITRTEREFSHGFADLFLEPFLAKYSDMQHGYLIDLKYIKRSKFSKKILKQQVSEAKEQLSQYLQDPIVQNQYASLTTTGLILVFNGWELVHSEALISS